MHKEREGASSLCGARECAGTGGRCHCAFTSSCDYCGRDSEIEGFAAGRLGQKASDRPFLRRLPARAAQQTVSNGNRDSLRRCDSCRACWAACSRGLVAAPARQRPSGASSDISSLTRRLELQRRCAAASCCRRRRCRRCCLPLLHGAAAAAAALDAWLRQTYDCARSVAHCRACSPHSDRRLGSGSRGSRARCTHLNSGHDGQL